MRDATGAARSSRVRGRRRAMAGAAGVLVVGLWLVANHLDPGRSVPVRVRARAVATAATAGPTTTPPPCDPERPAPACAAHARVLGADVVLDNLSSCASTADVVTLATSVDGDPSTLGGMLASGDVLIANDRYLAWLDTTWTPEDPIAGGLLRGLWSLTPTAGCHGLQFVNQPPYNELLPQPGNRGAGHSLLLNTAADCSDGGTIGGAARNLEFSAEWNRQPEITRRSFHDRVGSGVDYDISGHFMNPAGDINLDASTPGVKSMRYEQHYVFYADPAKGIRMTTALRRDGDATAVRVSQLFAADFDVERHGDLAEELTNANVARVSDQPPYRAAADTVVDDAPAQATETNWRSSDGVPLRPGDVWTMYAVHDRHRALTLRMVQEQDSFGGRFTMGMHVSWNPTRSDSLLLMAIQSAPACGDNPPLDGSYRVQVAFDLSADTPANMPPSDVP